MKPTIKIILADDHPVYRDGLRQMLAADPKLDLIYETGDGRDALEQARRLKAHILLLDVGMPRMDGVEVARERHRQKDTFDIIFLTMHREEDLFNQALELGVKGYLLKDSAAQEIRNAVHSVAEGRPYLSPALAEFVINQRQEARGLNEKKPELSNLSESERRILKLIASDRTSKEIAEDLGLSVRTVENHRSNICAKLNIRGSHALLKFAFEHRPKL